MKRALIIVVAIMMIAATGAFAQQRAQGLAIGGEGAFYFPGGGSLPVGGMFLLHIPNSLMLGLGVSSAPAIHITADYWFAQGRGLGDVLGWYVGIGGYLTLYLYPTSSRSASVGARLPLGLQLWPFREHLELFLEAAPAVGISFVPTGFDWHIQAAFGLRYWF